MIFMWYLIHAKLLFFSSYVMSHSLQTLGLQHTRLHYPTLSPWVCSKCLFGRWCHPNISPSVVLFSSWLLSFPAWGSFPMSWLFTSSRQSIGASASASVFPMNIQDWFPLGLTGWSPCCPRDCQESSLAPQFKSINSSVLSLLYGPTLTSVHDYSFDYMDFCWQSNACFLIWCLGWS